MTLPKLHKYRLFMWRYFLWWQVRKLFPDMMTQFHIQSTKQPVVNTTAEKVTFTVNGEISAYVTNPKNTLTYLFTLGFVSYQKIHNISTLPFFARGWGEGGRGLPDLCHDVASIQPDPPVNHPSCGRVVEVREGGAYQISGTTLQQFNQTHRWTRYTED